MPFIVGEWVIYDDTWVREHGPENQKIATLGELVDFWKKGHQKDDSGVPTSLEAIRNIVPNLASGVASPLRVGGIRLDVPPGTKLTIELPGGSW